MTKETNTYSVYTLIPIHLYPYIIAYQNPSVKHLPDQGDAAEKNFPLLFCKKELCKIPEDRAVKNN